MLSAAFLLLACSTYEAQFLSSIKEIHPIANEPYACHFILDLNLSKAGQSYSPSGLCPLDIDEVYGQKIYSARCHFTPGQEISGYLVKTNERIELE